MPVFRRFTFLLVLLLLAGTYLPARAQVAAPRAAPPAATIVVPRPALSDSAAEVAHEDTAIAVQRLFFDRRRRGRSRIFVGGIEVVAISYFVFGRQPHTVYQYVTSGLMAAAGIYYGYELVSGLVALRHFRPKRERRVLDAYEAGQPLPPKLRRQLASRYFSIKVTTF